MVDQDDDIGGGSDEARAELANLERMAAGDSAAQAAPAAEVTEPAAPQLDNEIAGMLLLASKMVAPMFPSVAEIYTEEACGAVGAAVAPVCVKHGWLQNGIGGEWAEELMCLAVVGPMAVATYIAASKDIEARAKARGKDKAKPEEKELPAPAGLPAVPGSDTVTFGAPVQ